jgi:hypothetical protein
MMDDVLRRLDIRAKPTAITYRNGIFAYRCQKHELVGYAAAHHAGVRRHGDNRQPHALEYPQICLVAASIIFIQIALRRVE